MQRKTKKPAGRKSSHSAKSHSAHRGHEQSSQSGSRYEDDLRYGAHGNMQRDEEGRFQSDDRSSQGGRGYNSRSGSHGTDRDEEGRFVSDDRSYQGSRNGGYNGRSGSHGAHERDEDGRFVSEGDNGNYQQYAEDETGDDDYTPSYNSRGDYGQGRRQEESYGSGRRDQRAWNDEDNAPQYRTQNRGYNDQERDNDGRFAGSRGNEFGWDDRQMSRGRGQGGEMKRGTHRGWTGDHEGHVRSGR